MSLRWMLPALLFALVLSVAIAVMAVGRDLGELLALATALFGAQVLLVAAAHQRAAVARGKPR